MSVWCSSWHSKKNTCTCIIVNEQLTITVREIVKEMERGREGWKEREREGGKEGGGREGEREGGKERGWEGRREGGREGEREGGKERERTLIQHLHTVNSTVIIFSMMCTYTTLSIIKNIRIIMSRWVPCINDINRIAI